MTSSSALSKISVAAKLWAFHQFGVSRCVPEKPHPSGWAFACLKSMADKRSVCFKHNAHQQKTQSQSRWFYYLHYHSSLGGETSPTSLPWTSDFNIRSRADNPKMSLSWRCASNTDYALTFRSKAYRLIGNAAAWIRNHCAARNIFPRKLQYLRSKIEN